MAGRFFGRLKKAVLLVALSGLSACAQFQDQPVATIGKVDRSQGYRFDAEAGKPQDDDMLVVLMFSGGGTRAAALGYGVLEELDKQKIYSGGQEKSLLEAVDLVYGVSGGSVLAAYFSLHGKETIPSFERRFLKQNFQRQVSKQVFSLANVPRLTSPEFGRGDLLQEQFESTLFKNATFGDLASRRKGPFAVITATDMSLGNRFEFTQEYFDMMCLNLSDLKIARAVAASSAVPLVFAPLTLNNNGGNCGYRLPEKISRAVVDNFSADKLQLQTRLEMLGQGVAAYQNSKERPYIHLLDGGLTDNLGLRSLLDMSELYGDSLGEQIRANRVRHIVIINGLRAVASAVIDIPIDRFSQETLRRFRMLVDQWNEEAKNSGNANHANMYFVSLNLRDLPESGLRNSVLNIPTSFYLPANEVNDLKEAGRVLLSRSEEYRRLLKDLSLPPPELKLVPEPAPKHGGKAETEKVPETAAPAAE